MSHKQPPSRQSPPSANYSSAIAKAVEWLGDRYLLARPINAPTRPHPVRWHIGSARAHRT
jgi:hypothetical protein